MKKRPTDFVRGASGIVLFLYACAAWLSSCTAKSGDADVVPIGHIVRTTACIVAWYIGHRALLSFCDVIDREDAETLADRVAAKRAAVESRPANQSPN